MTQAGTFQAQGGQGTQSAMPFDERLMDAKLDAVEARTETKFAQLLGKIDLLVQTVTDVKTDIGVLKTDIQAVDGHTRTSKREIIIAIVTTGFAVIALAWAGVQIFQGGLSIGEGAFQAGMAAAQTEQASANPQTSNRSGQTRSVHR
jgi:hypothetical protein